MSQNYPRSKLRVFAQFCNEWRDSIFYSLLVIGLLLNYLFSFKIQVSVFANCGEIREVARAISWGFLPGRNMRYALMGIFACEAIFLLRRLFVALTLHDPQIIHTINAFGVIMHLSFATIVLLRVGGFKNIYDAYRKTLFDYPRKMKPPGKIRKATLERLKEIWGKLKPRFSDPFPSPS